METGKAVKMTFTNVGDNDHLPYAKADITKIARISDNVSFSFYQLDYQALVVSMATPEVPQNFCNSMLISVGKIVLNTQGFLQLYDEMTQLKAVVEAETKK